MSSNIFKVTFYNKWNIVLDEGNKIWSVKSEEISRRDCP
jgi:hypothetical protein